MTDHKQNCVITGAGHARTLAYRLAVIGTVTIPAVTAMSALSGVGATATVAVGAIGAITTAAVTALARRQN